MRALWRATHIFDEVTAEIWKRLPLWHGGYFDGMYQLWAPGPITRMQMDSLDARGLYLLVVVKDFREVDTLRPILGM